MDYRFEWYSGTGKGGQHRNKHQNCCRCIHVLTGISANGTESKSRVTNQYNALAVCKARVQESLREDVPRFRAGPERIRTYNEADNRVVDHASGQKWPFREILDNPTQAIEARKLAIGTS